MLKVQEQCMCKEIRVWMRVYNAIHLPFLFHKSTISSKSLSAFLEDSMTIFVKLDRISSVMRLQRWFFMNFMSEKLCSSDAVEMGIDKHMVASLYRLEINVISMSLVSNSFSCMDIPSFDSLIRSWQYVFHSELRLEQTMTAFSNSVPSNNLAGKSLPMVLRLSITLKIPWWHLIAMWKWMCFVTTTSQQLEWTWSNGGLHPCVIIYLEE